MDLKDLILSTLAEIEKDEDVEQKLPAKEVTQKQPKVEDDVKSKIIYKPKMTLSQSEITAQKGEKENSYDSLKESTKPSFANGDKKNIKEEMLFLSLLRERILVLFEGLQSPNNKNLDAKVDLILNFFEYLLALIDKRVEELSIER